MYAYCDQVNKIRPCKFQNNHTALTEDHTALMEDHTDTLHMCNCVSDQSEAQPMQYVPIESNQVLIFVVLFYP